jgi:hypothetical protein
MDRVLERMSPEMMHGQTRTAELYLGIRLVDTRSLARALLPGGWEGFVIGL